MADRVHPDPLLPPPPSKQSHQPSSKSFIIQFPKDQIYATPPPANAYLFDFYTRRASKRHRSTCRRCVSFSFASLLVLLLSLFAITTLLYFILFPKLPSFSIQSLTASPHIILTVRSQNPNNRIGFYYRSGGSSIAVAFSGEVFSRGVWPAFYQRGGNATEFQTLLTGSGIRMSDGAVRLLTAAVNRREVVLEVRGKVPVRVKFGGVMSWTMTVKLRCDVTVDGLTADGRVLKRSCDDVKLNWT